MLFYKKKKTTTRTIQNAPGRINETLAEVFLCFTEWLETTVTHGHWFFGVTLGSSSSSSSNNNNNNNNNNKGSRNMGEVLPLYEVDSALVLTKPRGQ